MGPLNTRAGIETLVDGPRNALDAAGGVTDGRVAAHQRGFGLLERRSGDVVGTGADQFHRAEVPHQVHMHVREARHQHPAATVDAHCVLRRIQVWGDVVDLIALDQDRSGIGQCVALPIEDPDVRDQGDRRGLSPRARRNHRDRAGRRSQCDTACALQKIALFHGSLLLSQSFPGDAI
jgi:hypothetical protein